MDLCEWFMFLNCGVVSTRRKIHSVQYLQILAIHQTKPLYILFLFFFQYFGAIIMETKASLDSIISNKYMVPQKQPYRTWYHFQPPQNWMNGIILTTFLVCSSTSFHTWLCSKSLPISNYFLSFCIFCWWKMKMVAFIMQIQMVCLWTSLQLSIKLKFISCSLYYSTLLKNRL